jgi:YbbR domain-containing protein
MFYHPFRNLGLKFLSIGIAVLLWLTVAGEPIVERTLRVPLEVQNTPEALVVMEGPPSVVDVRVRGASSVLSHLDAGDVVAVLDINEARSGSRTFHLAPGQVRAPVGVEVVEVVPTSLSMKFEAAGTKAVPVTVVTNGVPAEGYEKGEIVVDPPQVEVSGPESALKAIKQAATEPLSIAGASGPVSETLAISVADPRVRLITAQTAKVAVGIRPAPVERTLASVPIRLRNAASGVRARVVPAVAQVVVRGPRAVLAALQPEAVGLYVDLAGRGRGRYNLTISVDPPRDLVIIRTQPATVSVTVQ